MFVKRTKGIHFQYCLGNYTSLQQLFKDYSGCAFDCTDDMFVELYVEKKISHPQIPNQTILG
jgi:hypothetical protein